MKKTVSINISGILFHVDDDAYAKLDAYLKSIHSHFRSYDDSEEIVADIESRIAEELSAKLSKKKTVIIMHDIEQVIASMGTVKDFKDFEENEEGSGHKHRSGFTVKGRLYRDADDQIVAGVASGIARYFDLDPIVFRLFFGLSIFFGGFGILLYILLWIIVPEARTTSEKVEMTGGRVNLSTIQKRIDETLPPEKRRTMLRKIISFPFILLKSVLRGVGRILSVVLPLVGRIIGAFVSIAMLAAIAGITFFLLMLVLNPMSPYIGLQMNEIAAGHQYVIFLLSAYFLAMLPLLFVLLFAISLMITRQVLSMTSVFGLVGLWFVALMIAAVTGSQMAPTVQAAVERYQEEMEDMVVQPYELEDFDRVAIGGRAQLDITQGDEFKVEVEAPRNVLSRVEVVVTDGVLMMKERQREGSCIFFCGRELIMLHVTMPQLTDLELTGAVSAKIADLTEESLRIESDGVSHLVADVTVKNLTIEQNGAGEILLTGEGDTLTVEQNGVSRIEAYEYTVKEAVINIYGPSEAYVNATDSLTGEINGPGSVYYDAVPPILNVELNGPARLEQRDQEDEYYERF